jgi:4-amino-4-deoxy-L-arabinose transferase-like glycosyltransferase
VLAIAFLTKFTAALLAVVIIIYLFLVDGVRWLFNKTLWKSAGLGLAVVIPFLLFEMVQFGSPFAFYTRAIGTREFGTRTLLQTFLDYVTTTFPLVHWMYLSIFIVGLLTFVKLFVCFDRLRKSPERELRADLLLLLSFIVPFLYLVSIGYGSYIEERYLFLMYPLLFIVAARGLWWLHSQIGRIHRTAALVLLVGVLLFGAFQNVVHADAIIKDKSISFIQIKETGVWLQENSQPDDLVVSFHTQAELQYHANRRVVGIPGANQSELFQFLKREGVDYYVANVFVPPALDHVWKVLFPYYYPEVFEPVLSLQPYIDKEQKIPILTLFRVKPEGFQSLQEKPS